MDSIPAYLAAKRDPKNVNYLHPRLKRILEETYGCMVYQEQVMEIVRDLAGYSLGRSDLVRRAMSKKKKDVMENERRIFINGDEASGVPGAVKRGVPAKTAEAIFDQMVDFAEYAFNKSHACAYAVITYYTAYLKCYYKVEYLTALLNSFIGTPDKISAYIQYCVSSGIKVLTPDINRSQFLFAPEEGHIRFGFAAIRDGGRAAEAIVTERDAGGPYTGFRNFINRTSSAINRKLLEGLILAGCFDSLGKGRAQLAGVADRVLKTAQDVRRKNVDGQMSLFDAMPVKDSGDADDYPDTAEWTRAELLSREKQATGVYLSGHPLDRFKTELDGLDINISKVLSAADDAEAAKYFESRIVDLVGILSGVRKRTTKLKKMMGSAYLEDLYGTIELMVFPSVFAKVEPLLVDDTIVTVTGKVDVREGEAPMLLVEDIKPYVRPDGKYAGKRLYVRVPEALGEDMSGLRRMLLSSPGRERVSVRFEQTGRSIRTSGSLAVTLTDKLVDRLREAYGADNVVVQ
jgi:DNA polymerase-3 subunit alpha